MPAGTALEGVTTVDGIVFHAAALGAYKSIGEPQTEQFHSAKKEEEQSLLNHLFYILYCHNDVPLVVLGTLSHITCPIKRTSSRYCGLLS